MYAKDMLREKKMEIARLETENSQLQAEVELLKTQRADGIPSVVPTNRGIQFEWHAGGIDLEIEVVSPSWIEMTFSDGELHEDFQHADFRMIKEKLDILRVRLQK